ncbi:4'-phosphopantetheinyl transferase superfamily protein [Kordia sp.]|uniref:4'-phosphopantetheinyl transferase family protein n=1 Tax=Kordia sp. TaxID=1965332 RepID=UPI0025B9C3A0|nr:4'-phosphopantetheinyl transferase superfamily protein [Kordia sp.]MCH2193547.1 4'-phosphopantetheinyl transferase superfamily protein [Kordia sp.]
MIDIFYTSFTTPIEEAHYTKLLSLLPKDLQERNEKFVRWQDKHANLFGKLLLIEALKYHDINNDMRKLITYGAHKRPFLTLPQYDFNISHSGDYVMCAIGENIRLGIDIEKRQHRNIENFDNSMTAQEWTEIQESNDSLKTFYNYWTIKESVSKADGRGFYIPYNQLEVIDNTVRYDGKLWFLQEISIADGYSFSIASNKLTSCKLHAIKF